MEALVYIVIGGIACMAILFMLGAAKLAGEADRQSETIGRALRRNATRDEDLELQDSTMGSAAGPRKVNPV